MTTTRRALALASAFLALGASLAHAEPMFLSKQYTQCAACHYSPTGGGLLTPYGRSLSGRELSITGRNPAPANAQPASTTGEEAFLWGALGAAPGPLQLGFDTRPAHLNFSFAGGSGSQNIFLNADLLAAYQVKGWTLYGEIGREPQSTGWKIDSYEYWVARQTTGGLALRVGRFLPAYGVRFADHTAFNRSGLGLDIYDQVYGIELSQTTGRSLVQVSVGPGRADSIIHNDGRRALTATGRFEVDLSPRTVVVASGLYRDASALVALNGASGVAFGFAPTSRVNLWTEADARFQQGATGGTSYVVVNETAIEAIRGVWLKFSPQIRTDPGDTSTGFLRAAFEADVLPRTHVNVDASYYLDRNRANDLVTRTFLVQLHLYL